MLKRLFQWKPEQDLSCEVANSGFAFDLDSKSTILQSAMNAGVDMPHNCQVGSCKECCCKLIEGEIKSRVELDYLFEQREIDAGYFLPCQSIAKSNLVIEPLKSLEKAKVKINATIESISDLTENIKRLTIKSEQPIKPNAGQYANITAPQIQEYRSYSFSSQDDSQCLYSFDITLHPNGKVSPWILDQKNISKNVQISQPLGEFSLSKSRGVILCIAAGSGQGALANILKTNAESLKGCTVIFLCSSKTMQEQYVKDELIDLLGEAEIIYTAYLTQLNEADVSSSERSSQLVSKSTVPKINGPKSSVKAGRIPEQLEADLRAIKELNAINDNFDQWSVLLCGAPGLINDSLKILESLGFRKNNISYDKYEVSGG